MSSQQRQNNDRIISTTKHYLDLVMGILYIFLSIYMLRLPTLIERFGTTTVYIFMGMFCIYGIYRIARGTIAILHTMKK